MDANHSNVSVIAENVEDCVSVRASMHVLSFHHLLVNDQLFETFLDVTNFHHDLYLVRAYCKTSLTPLALAFQQLCVVFPLCCSMFKVYLTVAFRFPCVWVR